MWVRGAKWDYRPGLQCDWCGAKTWTELRRNGQRQCRSCKIEKFYENVLYAPLGYSVPGWFRKVIRDLWTVNEESGLRQFRKAYISVAKQQGKSHGIGGLPIYHILMEDEPDPGVIGAAAAVDQASIVFDATAKMINASQLLSSKLKIIPSTRRIIEREGPGMYKVVSADGDVQDGQRPSLLIRDEIHRWKTLRHETVKDVLTKGQLSREEPLDIQITTAGAEYECALWWKEYQLAKLIQADQSIDPTYYVAIWEPDLKRIESEPEYWKSREARVAANPSHEDLGGHIKDTGLQSELNKAIYDPSERSKYLRYNLNVPLRTTEDPIIDIHRWQMCGDPQASAENAVDLRKWPSMDVELLLRKWGLVEEPCYVAVDASWTTDLTACVFMFPPTERNDVWTFLPFFWIAKERIPQIERVTRMPITDWVERGYLIATPGDGIDLRSVMDKIRWGHEMFECIELDFDRTNFRTQAMDLENELGLTAVEVKQNFMELSAATKFLLSGYMDKKFRHGNHPVLNWMAACLQLQYDRKDLVQPTKPERLKTAKRIDGIAAIVTGFARALAVTKPRKISRGIVII